MLDNYLNKIIEGDCLEILPTIESESVDCVITDPPYGMDYQSSWRIASERKDKIKNDEEPFTKWINEAYRVTKSSGCLLCFCRWDYEDVFKQEIVKSGWLLKSQVIWDRGVHGMGDLKSSFAPQHDTIWFAIKDTFTFPDKRPTSVIRSQRVDPDKMLHPTEKPIGLMTRLIESVSKKSDIILDPMAGSGSTLVAAKQLGRRYIGIELDPQYIKIANDRLAQEVLF